MRGIFWIAASGLAVFTALAISQTTQPSGEAVSPAPSSAAEMQAFDDLSKKVQDAPSSATEQEVLSLLRQGRALGRPYGASVAAKKYFAYTPEPTLAVLLAGADIATRAGDLQTAVARYKAYLERAKPSAEASDAAAAMYSLLIGFTNNEDDAYRFMIARGGEFRQSPAARRFDSWLIAEARRRNDLSSLAAALVRVLGDKPSAEQAQWYFGEDLNWLFTAAAEAPREQLASFAEHCRKLTDLLPDDRSKRRMAFCVAYLQYRLAADGKDAEQASKEFAPAAQAAMSYFNAYMSARTLQEIMTFFAGNDPVRSGLWAQQEAAKRDFFVECFGKLSSEDAEAMMRWTLNGRDMRPYIASPYQWGELGAKNAALFNKSPATPEILFAYNASDPNGYRSQETFLKGVPTKYSATVNSMTVGDDPAVCASFLVRQESWYLEFTDIYQIYVGSLVSNCQRLDKESNRQRPADFYDRQAMTFGRDVLMKSPAAIFDTSAVREYLASAWQYGGKDAADKSHMPVVLESLAWLPYTAEQRKAVLEQAYSLFKSWADGLSKTPVKERKEGYQAAMEQVSRIETAFRAVREAKAADPAKAPDALCRDLAVAVQAVNDNKLEAYLQAAKAIYPQVSRYDDRKTPYGRAILKFLLSNRPGSFDLTDFQCEVLADQLSAYSTKGPNRRVRDVLAWVVAGRDHGNSRWWANTDRTDTEKVLKFNAVFEKALSNMVDRKEFSGEIFDLLRSTRRGNGWTDSKLNEALLAKMIESKVLLGSGYRPTGERRYVDGDVTAYMYLITEFPGLAAKYPVATYFDDLYVQQAQSSGYLDHAYWNYGRDESKKVANIAAKLLAGMDKLPLVPWASGQSYSRRDLVDWTGWALRADASLRDALLAKLDADYGKTRFDEYAMGLGRVNMFDASSPANRKSFFDALRSYLDRAAAAPILAPAPYLAQMAEIEKGGPLSPGESAVLVRLFANLAPAQWPRNAYIENAASLLLKQLQAEARWDDLALLAPQFWRVARDCQNNSFQRSLAQVAKDMLDARQWDLAAIYFGAGLDVVGVDLVEDLRSSLVAGKSVAVLNIGEVIPVAKSDRRYAAFAAQAAYLGGRYQSAWETYRSNPGVIRQALRDLDPRFVLWLIAQETDGQNYDSAEGLGQDFMRLVDASPSLYDKEIRGQLLLAYADISLTRKEYPKARAQYGRLASAKEFEATQARNDAELRMAEVDRLTENYDQAIEELQKLSRRPEKYLQAQSFFMLGQIKFDQGEYAEANKMLDNVFVRMPNHVDAKILRGKVYLQLRKLMEATDIKVGLAADQRFIIPGRPLKVSIVDRNLAVVGKSTQVEIRAWTEHGDEETFLLLPFGDSKTEFQGQVTTQLAPISKGNHVLEVLGGEKVHYDFSPAFRQSHKIANDGAPELLVVTNAELAVSSGEILTAQQREQIALAARIRKKSAASDVALSTVRPENQIKPGNPLRVQVIDPDRSTTPGKDKVYVDVTTTSGDRVPSLALEETEEFSGVFTGSLPTATARATAYASDSQEGARPEFVICQGEHPGWTAMPDNARPKTFSVDLNDNISLGTMKISANVAGRKLRDFLLQTSINGRDFQTIGSYPDEYNPWDGSLRLETVKLDGKTVPTTLSDYREYLETGYLTLGLKKSVTKSASARLRIQKDPAELKALNLQRNDRVVMHLQGAFYVPAKTIRTFRLEMGERSPASASFLLAMDGEYSPLATEISRSLRKGVHRLDVYAIAPAGSLVNVQVYCDIPEAPYSAACPSEMFDPAQHPEIAQGVAVASAKIEAADDGGTFNITFGKDSRCRVFRLLLKDFETDAPAIQSITLKDGDGKKVLPVDVDLTRLNENQVLEIVPGDRLRVAYEDPTSLTGQKQLHEAFLTATYSNATLSACFVEYDSDEKGNRTPRYIPLRRFKTGDTVVVFINDPDCDISDKQDVVKIFARVNDGKPVELAALETEPHSGVFTANLLPVSGAPTQANEIQVGKDDDIILSYLDAENTDPGIAWFRTFEIEQITYTTPDLRVYDVTSESLPNVENRTGAKGGEKTDEVVPVRRRLVAARPAASASQPAVSARTLVEGPLLVEVVYPTIAQSPLSSLTLYAQTSSGRAQYGRMLGDEEFAVAVPGTIQLNAHPSRMPKAEPPGGYKDVLIRGDLQAADDPLEDGRFCFNVPLILGSPGTKSFVEDADLDSENPQERPQLAVTGGDTVFIGMQYRDQAGKQHWIVRKVALTSDVLMDVMDRRYQQNVSSAYIGESAYFRVIHKSLDITDQKDRIQLTLFLNDQKDPASKLDLLETFGHSGVFKGMVKFNYAEDKAAKEQLESLPVNYGDVVHAVYASADGKELARADIAIQKGADGQVLPFTKRFKDESIAVQTQFTIAESYFELAKRHRQLKQESLARREIAQGKKLLEEAIRDYPRTEARAQAEYLLANLAYEFANDAVDPNEQKKFCLEAVSRFSDIVATFPDSPYAPKAQYKKALVFEKMGQIDQACEEYVKLSYRYPDNELVAETIARLGQYFLAKGKAMEEAAEKEADANKKAVAEKETSNMYVTAAQVFSRLAVRFPTHHLAGATNVLSAQCYLRGKVYDKAVAGFEAVIKNENADKDHRAESMFWCGQAYMQMPRPDLTNAYRMFKKLTWDYPESKWAPYARGQLATQQFLTIEEQDSAAKKK